MKFTPIIIALALTSAVMPLAAMQRMNDAELSHMEGGQGLSDFNDLKVQIGTLTSFMPLAQSLLKINDLLMFGQIGTKVDMLSDSMYAATLSESLRGYGIKDSETMGIISSVGHVRGTATAGVVQIAFSAVPISLSIDGALTPNIASVNPSLNGSSMNNIVLKDVSLVGTKIWVQNNSR